MDKPLVRLHQFIDGSYDLEEFRTLCFAVGVDFDNLRGETIASKAQELVLYLVSIAARSVPPIVG